MAFLRAHIPEAGTVPLAGNSIGTDRRFLAAQMPEVESFLHYRSRGRLHDQGARPSLAPRGAHLGPRQGRLSPSA